MIQDQLRRCQRTELQFEGEGSIREGSIDYQTLGVHPIGHFSYTIWRSFLRGEKERMRKTLQKSHARLIVPKLFIKRDLGKNTKLHLGL